MTASRTGVLLSLAASVLVLGLVVESSLPAHAAIYTVETTEDGRQFGPVTDGVCQAEQFISPGVAIAGPCTLRAAVQEANGQAGPDTITLAAGVHLLDIAGIDEDSGSTGDLDVLGSLTITGAGAGVTIVDGGALDRVFHVLSDSDTLTLSNLTIRNGLARNGGGLLNGGSVRLDQVTVADNTALDGPGGGIFSAAGTSLTIVDSTIEGNDAPTAGGLFGDSGSTITITASTVCDNASTGDAGGIWAETLDVESSTIRDNTAERGVGGLRAAALTLTASTVSGNRARAGDAGAIQIATLGVDHEIINTTISGNTASDAGGGIHFVAPDGTLTLLNTTIAANLAGPDAGGGLHRADGTLRIHNTIIATNGPRDCAGTITSLGNNLDGDHTCQLTALGELPGRDPRLGPLSDNGGTTQTHVLLPGSPAINLGSIVIAPLADQRGVLRVGQPDMGAFEFEGPFPADADDDGFDSIATGGADCDDTDVTIFPGAPEVLGDGIDQDCDGADQSGQEPAPQPGGTILLPIGRGLTLVGWLGVPTTAREIIESNARIRAIWFWEAADQRWLLDSPILPDLLRILIVIERGDGFFVESTSRTELEVPLP